MVVCLVPSNLSKVYIQQNDCQLRHGPFISLEAFLGTEAREYDPVYLKLGKFWTGCDSSHSGETE